jgi:hypothetical protein
MKTTHQLLLILVILACTVTGLSSSLYAFDSYWDDQSETEKATTITPFQPKPTYDGFESVKRLREIDAQGNIVRGVIYTLMGFSSLGHIGAFEEAAMLPVSVFFTMGLTNFIIGGYKKNNPVELSNYYSIQTFQFQMRRRAVTKIIGNSVLTVTAIGMSAGFTIGSQFGDEYIPFTVSSIFLTIRGIMGISNSIRQYRVARSVWHSGTYIPSDNQHAATASQQTSQSTSQTSNENHAHPRPHDVEEPTPAHVSAYNRSVTAIAFGSSLAAIPAITIGSLLFSDYYSYYGLEEEGRIGLTIGTIGCMTLAAVLLTYGIRQKRESEQLQWEYNQSHNTNTEDEKIAIEPVFQASVIQKSVKIGFTMEY